MKNEYYSQSKIRSWRKCPKSFEYRYYQGLTKRVQPAALIRGTTLHAMLECKTLGTDWEVPLEEYRKVYGKLWDEERDGYPSPDELKGIYLRYCDHWKNDGLDYGGRAEIEVVAEHRGITFKGIVDSLPEDSSGRHWLSDYKTHRIIPDEETRFSDIQTVLYYWGLKQSGQQVDGVMWDYLRTKPPTEVEVLKKGGLTRRANLDTDYATYMKAIQDNGLDPADYQAELERTKKNVFFQRVYLPQPNDTLVEAVVKDFFDTAEEIENAKCHPRAMSRDCKGCTYYPVCQAEVRGIDSSFIRKQMYTLREDK